MQFVKEINAAFIYFVCGSLHNYQKCFKLSE